MTKLTENGRQKLQTAEQRLLDAGFNSVWQKVQERFPYDTIYSYWVNLNNGKGILLVLVQNSNLLDSLRVYALKEQSLESAIADDFNSSAA